MVAASGCVVGPQPVKGHKALVVVGGYMFAIWVCTRGEREAAVAAKLHGNILASQIDQGSLDPTGYELPGAKE